MVTSFGAQALPPFPPVSDRYRRLANLRDLAGLRLAGAGTVAAGVLYRSDAPYPGDLAPDTVPVWPPATVIDLRSSGETVATYRWPAGGNWPWWAQPPAGCHPPISCRAAWRRSTGASSRSSRVSWRRCSP